MRKKVSPYFEGEEFTYTMVEYDAEGWADASKYLPQDYDLCYLMLEGNKKPVSGWSVGLHWEGLRVERASNVLLWKRQRE
jgi:hypothetical protein